MRPACGGRAPRREPRLTSGQRNAVKWVIINDLWYYLVRQEAGLAQRIPGDARALCGVLRDAAEGSGVGDGGWRRHEGSQAASSRGPQWLEYSGSAHTDPFAASPRPQRVRIPGDDDSFARWAEDRERDRESGGFTTLDENYGFRLLGTPHGVVVMDKAQSRYAWVYVFEGGSKLGFGSVLGAKLEGARVTVTVHKTPRFIGWVDIDLTSGAYEEEWEVTEGLLLVGEHTAWVESGCGNGVMARIVRHRQTKAAETDRPILPPPRHIPSLPKWPPGCPMGLRAALARCAGIALHTAPTYEAISSHQMGEYQ